MRETILFLFSMIACISYAQWATFTPQVYTPKQHDNTALQRSLEQLEQRKIQANEQYNKLQMALAEYSSKLYNDEATLIWFDDYKKLIRQSFESLSSLGWDEARDYAIRKQGEVAVDPELMARIRTASEYNNKRKAIEESKELNWQEKQEWIKYNPYCFVPIKNHQGEVIGGRLGSKEEYDAQKAEEESKRKAAANKAREEAELEKLRLYGMEHPFDKYDYSSYDTIIPYPDYKKCPEGVVVTKVALSPNETRVEFEAKNLYYNGYCCVDWQIYLSASGTGKLRQIKVENIAIAPSKFYFKEIGERLKFAITFPALPAKTKFFSISETVKNGWKFKDIKIR